MKIFILSFCLLLMLPSMAQQSAGIFKHSADIGNPKVHGAYTYNKDTKTYTIQGGGYNIWFNRDELYYVYNQLKGDFTLTANFSFEGDGKEAHRKIGWMIRPSLNDSDMHITATLHGDGLAALQWRVKPGMNMRDPEDELFAPEKKLYSIIQLQRKGNTFTMRVAEKEGAPFITIGEHTMENFSSKILAGIFICSHNADVMETAKVWNVKIEQ